MTRRYIETLRKIIEMLSAHLTDEEALDAPDLFPHWSPDKDCEAGQRLCYEGQLYKVNPPGHSANPTWNPVDAPSLYTRILPGQDGTEIGVWEQPDSTNGYRKGDRVHYPTMDDPIYESIYEGLNVWSPAAFPAGWKVVEE